MDEKIVAVLSASSNQKLLRFWDGVQLTGFLLLHSAPQEMIRKIGEERPVEDLLFLFMAIGMPRNRILQTDASIKKALMDRAVELVPMLRAENSEFEVVVSSLDEWRGNFEKTKRLADELLEACSKPGFKASE
jgi:hypothetical protein